MRPLIAETRDSSVLQDLGLASIQIVHDLKNQLNGLKLYATFLRKRMETSERPADELEVIGKLIAGIERTASELTILVRYGRPIELKARRGVPLTMRLSSLKNRDSQRHEIQIEVDDGKVVGEFDPAALGEAFRSITDRAFDMLENGEALLIRQRLDENRPSTHVAIEWCNLKITANDVFSSLTGADALHMALAAKIIAAHQGTTEQKPGMLCVSLPIHSV